MQMKTLFSFRIHKKCFVNSVGRYFHGRKMNEEVMDSKELQVGDVVTGSVTKVEEKQVLVNVGYKTDGVIPISELANVHIEKASDVVELDQTLELKIIKLEEDDLVLSKRAVDAEKHG